MRSLLHLAFGLSLLPGVAVAQNTTPGQPFAVLHPDDYRHYVVQFSADEREATAQQPEEVIRDLRARDARDRNRADSPLKPAPDANLLDSTNMTLEEAVRAAENIVSSKLSLPVQDT